MASAPVVLNEVLQASPEKDNFMRLLRLLNCGGTKIVRGYFDYIITDLTNKLSDPLVLNTLNGLKRRRILNNSEWDKLYPSNSSTVVESNSFDLTLLVKLLRQTEISGLGNPVNGWDNLPSQADTTLEADIARLKWYRNKFAHPDTMEVGGNDFNHHWDDIKGALLRIVGSYSPSSVTKCEKDIDKFRTAALGDVDLAQVRESLGCSEILVRCTPRIASTGLEWVKGGAYILGNCIKGILEYLDPMEGVEVVNVTEGSVVIMLWVTDSTALERFWRIYETGELTKEFERILLTEELRQLAKDDKVELEVIVSEEEYKRAQKQLQAKEEEKLPEEFETKMRIEQKSKFQIFDGDVVEDGENRVQAHLAVITSKDQVEQVLAELMKKKDPDVVEATHNIWAYRIFDTERNSFDENCDDDGDDSSGARVLRFLQRTRATDVMVVVSCWYETTAEDFGEVRFTYIQKSVLDLLLTSGIEIRTSKLKKYFEEIKYTPFEKAKEQETPKFDILHGETIEDRKSTFQAHLADITSREQVDQVLDELKKDRKIENAKYNMWACRIYDEKKKSFFEEGNDDGENFGGERLLHLLHRSDAKNVVVIVTRWHGGIHLGNDRFKHINKCASDLLQQRRKIAETATASTDPKAATTTTTKARKEKSKKH